MGKEWDKIGSGKSYEHGGTFTSPGIGERHIKWPSFSSTSKHGTTNPTCAECGGRLRGAKKCHCPQPHDHWKPMGKRRNAENEGLPDDQTGGGMGNHLEAMEAWHLQWLQEAYRVLESGGVIKAFSGTRTFHRLAAALEKVGFTDIKLEAWVYGSGFPKSLNIGKTLDKQAGRVNTSIVTLKKELRALFDASGKSRKAIDGECGFRACNYLSYPEPGKQPDPWFNVLPSQAKWQVMKQVLGVEGTDREAELDGFFAEAEREVIGFKKVVPGVAFSSDGPSEMPVTLPASEAAQQWEGWGTALKPSWEPVLVGTKPPVDNSGDNGGS